MKNVSFDVKEGGTLKIRNEDGNIDISTWDKDEIKVEYTIRPNRSRSRDARRKADDLEIDFIKSGNNLRIINPLSGNNFSVNIFFEMMQIQPLLKDCI